MRLTKLFVLLALAGSGAAEAATINASSCNLSAVSLVVTSATDGDTVVIPAGTCSWSGPLSISNKSITLKGQGIGSTVIVSSQEIRANDAYASIVGVLLRTGAQARQSVSMAAELRARFNQFSPHLSATEGPASASGER